MIKFINIIRLSALIIALFGNETIFGMMLPTNFNNKEVEEQDKNNSSDISLLLLGKDIIQNHIVPRSYLAARLISKKFVFDDSILPELYAYYWNAERKVVPACAFLDCVNKGEYEKAKWFVDNKQDEPLFFVISHYKGFYNKYSVLNPYTIAQNNNDEKMMKLLKDYKDYNVYTKIKKVQESIGHIGPKIRSLSDPVDGISWKKFVIDIYYPLCIAACTGDIKSFELEIQKCFNSRTLNQVLDNNIPLIMWIAIKNRDLSFISYLLNDSSVKKSFNDYMQDNRSNINLLWFMSLNVPLEWTYDFNLYPRLSEGHIPCINSDKVVLTKKHIDGVEKIIKMGMFTSISLLLEEFKDKNEGIGAVYEIFYKELDRQAEEETQYSCLIQ